MYSWRVPIRQHSKPAEDLEFLESVLLQMDVMARMPTIMLRAVLDAFELEKPMAEDAVLLEAGQVPPPPPLECRS